MVSLGDKVLFELQAQDQFKPKRYEFPEISATPSSSLDSIIDDVAKGGDAEKKKKSPKKASPPKRKTRRHRDEEEEEEEEEEGEEGESEESGDGECESVETRQSDGVGQSGSGGEGSSGGLIKVREAKLELERIEDAVGRSLGDRKRKGSPKVGCWFVYKGTKVRITSQYVLDTMLGRNRKQ